VDVGEPAVPRPTQSLTAYPNPFNPSTTVSFTLDNPESCTVNIYNTRGQLVRQLASGRFDTGDHSVTWDGSDDHGLPQSTGVYLIRLQAGTKTTMKRVTLLK
jgi:flagellar hook assembly protein FlgD